MLEVLDRHRFNMANHEPFTQLSRIKMIGSYGVRFSILPSTIRVEFEDSEKAWWRITGEIRRTFCHITNVWRLEGMENQREVKRACMKQLEKDAA
jgi:hypothetical protein